MWTKVSAPGVNVHKVEPAPPTEREKAEEGDIDDITTVKSAEIEEFLAMSLDDDQDDKPGDGKKADADVEMPDYSELMMKRSRSSWMMMRRSPPRERNASRKATCRNHLLLVLSQR